MCSRDLRSSVGLISLWPPKTLEDFKSKYLDVYEQTKNTDGEAAASIINEVDFELDLVQRDEINVAYILSLLAKMSQNQSSTDPDKQAEGDQQRKQIFDLLGSDVKLGSKRELIERFINEYMPAIQPSQDLSEHFADFWAEEKQKQIRDICESEGLKAEALNELIESYHFTGKEPLSETIVSDLIQKPKILDRKAIVKRVTEKLMSLVRVFDDDMGDI